MAVRQKITTYLWFDDNAEEAMNLYVSTFKNSKVLNVWRNGADEGKVLMCTFELEGQRFMALNGGPQYRFTEAISLFVTCESQAEVDDLWDRLIAGGGAPSRCGWLKDRFGLSWQIIPRQLMELMSDKDPEKAGRVTQAMLGMEKIIIAELEAAHAGTAAPTA